MSVRLPEIRLDDRTFTDLVDEARHRIARACPEWTEHNLSDPGVTLIEMFAWLTEMVIYRLNRVPDKLHVALMELMNIGLAPPAAARAHLRFSLSAPARVPVEIPLRAEIGTFRTLGDESTVFQTSHAATIPPVGPVAFAVQRERAFAHLVVGGGAARPRGSDRFPFATPPVPGDALYLGFRESLAGLVMRVDVECSAARGVGVEPADPPLRWEVSADPDGGTWGACDVLSDTTGGFNYGSGRVELQVPDTSIEAVVDGKRAHWLRCRVDQRGRADEAVATYTHPPEITSVTAGAAGVLVHAEHAVSVVHEDLGDSDGTPGQEFRLRHRPVLEPEPGETLEVRGPGDTEWVKWTRRSSFAESGGDDRHYTLDLASGHLSLPPSVRIGDGAFRQFGAIPEKGAELRMSRYRHGGGAAGNVAADTLTVMRSAIPYVASVTNPGAASGGLDPESLDEARRRAALELRSRSRAVTADDHEFLALRSSPRVARAICVEVPDAVGVARIHLVPRIEDPARRLELHELEPAPDLLDSVASALDDRRLIGTRIELLPARYRAISVAASVRAEPTADLARVERDVATALYRYLNPIVGGSLSGVGAGWEFGRSLNQGELYGIVHAVDGVQFVSVLRLYEVDLANGKRAPVALGSHVELAPDAIRAEHEEI
jgi:predicted phage baseplate assembly protein